MMRLTYRQYLRAVVAASAAPYGYTLTLWTSGAVTTHAKGVPSTAEALLLLAGAITAFGGIGALAFGSVNSVLVPANGATVRVWGAMHLPSVGLSVLVSSAIAAITPAMAAWPLVGFAATACYLLVLSGQFWLATHRGAKTSAVAAAADE